MPKDTITLALNGDVPLQLFSVAMVHLCGLITALTDELGVAETVNWFVYDLQPGSAIVTMRGEADISDDVERVVIAYGQVGSALAAGSRPAFSENTVREARAITHLLNGTITSVRFETPDMDAEIASPQVLEKRNRPPQKSLGFVKGRIETISSRKGLRFNLYDATYNRAVACYFDEGKEDVMREMWGKIAKVEGEISRDSAGRPVAVRHIRTIREVPEGRGGNYLAARGVAPRIPGSPRAEETIRRLRDA